MPQSCLRTAILKRPSAGSASAVFLNTGQVCLCAERVYVQQDIFDRFVASPEARWPRACELGCAAWRAPPSLVRSFHRSTGRKFFPITSWRVKKAPTTVTGGGVPQFGNALDNGFYVQPTIYTGLAESARCVKEEIFGPVCHVAPFDFGGRSGAMANDTKYGLAASIWTSEFEARTPRGPADECGHHMGELLVPARSANAVWRSGPVGDWARGWHALAEFLF